MSPLPTAVPRSLDDLLAQSEGKSAPLLLTSFPFLTIGSIVSAGGGTVTVMVTDGVPLPLRGHGFTVDTGSVAALYVEREPGEIPALDGRSAAKGAVRLPLLESASGEELASGPHPEVAQRLLAMAGEDVMLVLKPDRLHLLGQVFRPIVVGTVASVQPDTVWLDRPNLRLMNAPDFVFPLPLVVPLGQVALFTRFARETLFTLT